MKIVLRHAAPALLTLAFLSNSVWAQTPASGAVGASSASAATAGHSAKRHAFLERRLSELHAQLKITPAEAPLWDAFAQTMRDSSEATEQAYADRADKLPTLNADDAMKSYADLAQLHADNTQKLAKAFSPLYAGLSDEQKKTADVLFRKQPTQPPAKARKRAHAADAASSATESASAPAAASN